MPGRLSRGTLGTCSLPKPIELYTIEWDDKCDHVDVDHDCDMMEAQVPLPRNRKAGKALKSDL